MVDLKAVSVDHKSHRNSMNDPVNKSEANSETKRNNNQAIFSEETNNNLTATRRSAVRDSNSVIIQMADLGDLKSKVNYIKHAKNNTPDILE